MGGAVEGLAAISPFPIDVRCGCGHRIRVRFGGPASDRYRARGQKASMKMSEPPLWSVAGGAGGMAMILVPKDPGRPRVVPGAVEAV